MRCETLKPRTAYKLCAPNRKWKSFLSIETNSWMAHLTFSRSEPRPRRMPNCALFSGVNEQKKNARGTRPSILEQLCKDTRTWNWFGYRHSQPLAKVNQNRFEFLFVCDNKRHFECLLGLRSKIAFCYKARLEFPSRLSSGILSHQMKSKVRPELFVCADNIASAFVESLFSYLLTQKASWKSALHIFTDKKQRETMKPSRLVRADEAVRAGKFLLLIQSSPTKLADSPSKFCFHFSRARLSSQTIIFR